MVRLIAIVPFLLSAACTELQQGSDATDLDQNSSENSEPYLAETVMADGDDGTLSYFCAAIHKAKAAVHERDTSQKDKELERIAKAFEKLKFRLTGDRTFYQRYQEELIADFGAWVDTKHKDYDPTEPAYIELLSECRALAGRYNVTKTLKL